MRTSRDHLNKCNPNLRMNQIGDGNLGSANWHTVHIQQHLPITEMVGIPAQELLSQHTLSIKRNYSLISGYYKCQSHFPHHQDHILSVCPCI